MAAPSPPLAHRMQGRWDPSAVTVQCAINGAACAMAQPLTVGNGAAHAAPHRVLHDGVGDSPPELEGKGEVESGMSASLDCPGVAPEAAVGYRSWPGVPLLRSLYFDDEPDLLGDCACAHIYRDAVAGEHYMPVASAAGAPRFLDGHKAKLARSRFVLCATLQRLLEGLTLKQKRRWRQVGMSPPPLLLGLLSSMRCSGQPYSRL